MDGNRWRTQREQARVVDAGGSARPSVAVVIVNYNATDLLRRALAALVRQTRPPERVLVVDNGSTGFDAAGFAGEFPWIELIPLDHNIGFAAANNRAIARAAECDLIALLNPDAFPEPDWLATLVAAAASHPLAASFSSRLLRADDPQRLDGTGDCYHPSGRGWRRDEGLPAGEGTLAPGEVFSACAAAALYRRTALEEAGGFDERFFCYFEDVDLGFRLRLLGWGCRYVPESVAHHVGSAVTVRHSDFSVYHGHRNLVWTYVKNMPPVLFWTILPLHLLLNIATVVSFAVGGRLGLILRAKGGALRGLRAVWQSRQTIQRARRIGNRSLLRAMTLRFPRRKG